MTMILTPVEGNEHPGRQIRGLKTPEVLSQGEPDREQKSGRIAPIDHLRGSQQALAPFPSDLPGGRGLIGQDLGLGGHHALRTRVGQHEIPQGSGLTLQDGKGHKGLVIPIQHIQPDHPPGAGDIDQPARGLSLDRERRNTSKS